MAGEALNNLGPIFLSASVPERQPSLYVPEPTAIADAVRALVVETVRDRRLVFGGHPAISPLVEYAARSLGAVDQVEIYQSRFFENIIPPIAKTFPNLRWTPAVGTDKPASLLRMREEMIQSHTFVAAVFIGGMDGVEAEWDLFGKIYPHVPRFPVASTLGAAWLLWQNWTPPQIPGRSLPPDTKDRLAKDPDYRMLFHDLLG
jgi:hypothetical protein